MTLAEPVVARHGARREQLRQAHQEALDELVAPVEELFVRTALRLVREALAVVSPSLVAAVDPMDLTAGMSRLADSWVEEAPKLAGELAKMYETGGMAIAHDLGAVAQMRTIDYLDRATNRLVGISDSMWEGVRFQLQAGIASGADIEQMSARVQQALDTTEVRARTIARTETIGALNSGSLDGAQSTGTAPQYKEWLATDDDRTRDDHFEADGQRVLLDEPFMVGGFPLAYPGDENGPPEQVINCRCTLIYTDEPPGDGEVVEPEETSAEEVTVEEPLTHSERAVRDITDARTEYDALSRELRNIDPRDTSPDLLRTWEKNYDYQAPWEVRVGDRVMGPDGRMTITDAIKADLQPEEWRGLTLVQRDLAPLDDAAGQLERASTKIGEQVDNEVRRRLEEQGTARLDAAEVERRIDGARSLWEEARDATRVIEDTVYEEVQAARRAGDIAVREVRSEIDRRLNLDPEWVRWEVQRTKAWDEMQTLRNAGDFMSWRDEYARVAREVLDEVRGVGGVEIGVAPGSVKDSVSVLRVVEDVYPREWVEAANARGQVQVGWSQIPELEGRGYYQDGAQYLANVNPAESGAARATETAVHEYGHRMEYTRTDIMDLERQFYERRTAGESAQWLGDLTGDVRYGADEMAREDKFVQPYMGKDYTGRGERHAWELFTMGSQAIISPEVSGGASSWVSRLFANDPDYVRWFLGVLFSA